MFASILVCFRLFRIVTKQRALNLLVYSFATCATIATKIFFEKHETC
jgi:hypothetical protein